jgi:hypothetical protein
MSRRVDTAQFFALAIIFGEVMRKTTLQKFHHTIHHTNLKAANLRFVRGIFSREYTIRFSTTSASVRVCHARSRRGAPLTIQLWVQYRRKYISTFSIMWPWEIFYHEFVAKTIGMETKTQSKKN